MSREWNRSSGILFGGDYNPEQYPREVWREDIRLMKDAGVNIVTVGVFAWSRIQPAEGVFDWEWLDTILGMLHDAGIAVDLATATASPPPWAVSSYPEILPVDERGAVLWPNSRQHFAPTSPVYRRLAAELVEAMVTRYADHPAIVMWHVNNEYGCHVARDYSENARIAFRTWLTAKYGDVHALNEAWGTAFWSQIVTDFSQIQPPLQAPTFRNPATVLDFKRFSSDALLSLFVMERDILRHHGVTQPITTNFMGAFEGADYWAWAAELDFVSNDVYPDPNDPTSFRSAAFVHDLMRSLKPDQPWLLMEQAAEAVTWMPSNAPKKPGQMSALSAQAIGRGSDGVLFFQWRQSPRGAEQYLTAMLPHAGTGTRTWKEVVALGHAVAELPPLGSTDLGADIALVFDWESWWALESAYLPIKVDYQELSRTWYDAFHSLHMSVDFVRPDADLTRYRLVVAPALYLLTEADARNLTAFVDGGGHLLVTAYSDIVGESNEFRSGGFQTLLGEALGVSTLEFGALLPPAGRPGSDGPGERLATAAGEFGEFTGQYLAEEIDLRGAAARAHFTSGRRDGRPALTSHSFGAGTGYYLATMPTDSGATAVARWLVAQAGLWRPDEDLPATVEVIHRGDVTIGINHGDAVVRTSLSGHDLLQDRPHHMAELGSQQWVMLRA